MTACSSSSHSEHHMASELEDQMNSNVNSIKSHRLFGREKPMYKLLGGGKLADVLMWRQKKAAVIFLTLCTMTWVLFECLDYRLITLICYVVIIYMVAVCIYTKGIAIITRSSPRTMKIRLSEDAVLKAASAIVVEANRMSDIVYGISSGKGSVEFLRVNGCLWIMSVIGGWCNFVTLFYFGFVVAFTVPVLYDKYENEVDLFANKAWLEIKKYYMQISEMAKVEMNKLYSQFAHKASVQIERQYRLLADQASMQVKKQL